MTARPLANEPEVIPPPADTDAPTHRNGNGTTPVVRTPFRVPPHEPDAERAVISACLYADTATVDAVAHLAPSDFYSPRHAAIWTAILDLHAQGVAPDGHLITVEAELVTELATNQLAYRSNVANYAAVVAERAHRRRIIGVAADLADAAYNGTAIDPSAVAEKLSVPASASTQDEWVELDAFIDTDEPDHDWLIPGLLERADRCIITATPGSGKSTLLRQIGVMAASGMHPFTGVEVSPVRVLMLDVENSARQIRREIRPLRDAAGSRYDPGMVEIRVYGEAINLADPATLSDIMRHVDEFKPGIICTGPLYKLIGGDPVLEKDARPVADAFDRIRHVCGSAVIIEAHSPYPVGKTTVIRPYGASLWERWPEFGWYFSAAGNIEHWRGQREERQWPVAIERSTPWPWASRHIEPTRAEAEEWHGPTQCIQAVVDFLRRHPDEDLTGNQLYTRLRADNQGRGFREQTVREAAEIAANNPDQPVTVRNGARNARLFSYSEAEVEPELF